jgi:hypothetical protein
MAEINVSPLPQETKIFNLNQYKEGKFCLELRRSHITRVHIARHFVESEVVLVHLISINVSKRVGMSTSTVQTFPFNLFKLETILVFSIRKYKVLVISLQL